MQYDLEYAMKVLSKIGLHRNKNSMYGPTLPMEMRFVNGKKEVEDFIKKIYGVCDGIFKFFSWCVGIAVVVVLWRNTHFGVFIVVIIVMITTLLAYTIAVSIYPAIYIAERLSKLGVNSKIVFTVLMALIIVSSLVVPRVFSAGLGRMVRAQSCSMYHKDSPNIPSECRKYVKL